VQCKLRVILDHESRHQLLDCEIGGCLRNLLLDDEIHKPLQCASWTQPNRTVVRKSLGYW
ncbi:MAG TPA: hypothetical protein VNN22_12895, partial [Verrucomicrobiae bacterium]|nr:hypothetical protein [Verrucomicrobiae bacterium]